MGISLNEGLMDIVSRDFDNDFSVKLHIVLLLSLIRKGYLTLNLKEKMVVVLLFIYLHVPSVGRNMMVVPSNNQWMF